MFTYPNSTCFDSSSTGTGYKPLIASSKTSLVLMPAELTSSFFTKCGLYSLSPYLVDQIHPMQNNGMVKNYRKPIRTMQPDPLWPLQHDIKPEIMVPMPAVKGIIFKMQRRVATHSECPMYNWSPLHQLNLPWHVFRQHSFYPQGKKQQKMEHTVSQHLTEQ